MGAMTSLHLGGEGRGLLLLIIGRNKIDSSSSENRIADCCRIRTDLRVYDGPPGGDSEADPAGLGQQRVH